MHSQRYTSKELTHFVARGCKLDDGKTFDQKSQYACLVKILNEGHLVHRRDDPDGPARVSFLGS